MTHVRLAMLARDEADRLPALAANLAGQIHSVMLLLDTRTGDDTSRVAHNLWPSCVAYPHHFDDFSKARNLLLDLARPKADYLLLLDPDSPLIGALPDPLEDAAYSCEWRYHGLAWQRVILLRTDTPATYTGTAHEVLSVAAPVTITDACHVQAEISASAERLAWIEAALREDAATNPRSCFYLAQTLRDQGRRDEAFGWYMRRAAMSYGWAEETYQAVYEAALIVQTLDAEIAATLWQRALALRPRSEPCYQLARQANWLDQPSEALKWASLGLRLAPSTDELFVNRWIEQEGLSIEFETAAKAMLGIQPATVEAPHA